jgi:hypothetical protein
MRKSLSKKEREKLRCIYLMWTMRITVSSLEITQLRYKTKIDHDWFSDHRYSNIVWDFLSPIFREGGHSNRILVLVLKNNPNLSPI